MRIRHLILVTALPLWASAATGSSDLPPGLTRDGNTVTMQPVESGKSTVNVMPLKLGGYRLLSAADHDIFVRAFEAADKQDWRQARQLAAQGQDKLAAKLIEWRYLTAKNSGAGFAEIDDFLKANPDWPGRDTLFARAEAQIGQDAAPAFVVGWFAGREPVSAIGKIRLGLAEAETGNKQDAARHIRQGWVEGVFERDEELFIVQHAGSFITPAIDVQRLDALIWSTDYTSARRQLARVGNGAQAVAKARLDIRTSRQDARKIVAGLPADLAHDPALQFDLAANVRRLDGEMEAQAILQRTALAAIAREQPRLLWRELSIAARRLLQEGDPQSAYDLLSKPGLTADPDADTDAGSGEGSVYAEIQFMAGWIGLRFLNSPKLALDHFDKFIAHVTRPISLGRGYYWRGRALEAAGDGNAAIAAYGLAARESDTFYGQLAMTKIEKAPILRIRQSAVHPAPARAAFEQDELVRAMRVLADLDQRVALRVFALHYRKLHPTPGHDLRLTRAIADMGYLQVALRLAKQASYERHWFADYSHPVISLPRYVGPDDPPEKALVHSLIRQETEFDPRAVSHAGARGLMQIMPKTARKLSRSTGLPYRPNDLTDNPVYNMKLGMAEYAGYLKDWNGSISLAAAAYNAGPNNAQRWIAMFGDPRQPTTDPIDWIEQITYGETRNYVQRVIENLQVYRARLNGGQARLKILDDLYGTNPKPGVLKPTPPKAAVKAEKNEKRPGAFQR